MATYQVPQAQRGMEHTPSDPMQGTADEPQNSAQLTEEDQQRLIALVRRYKDQWSQDRVVLMQRCLQNLEFFKGNQFISFGPGQSEFFNAVDWMNQGDHAQDADDKDLYQYCNNFYQMLATGFVAALAPQVPKSKWMPEDAEQLTDVTTARAAQTLIDIIERQNSEQSLLKQQLLYLYTTGAVFRHTRYVVDGERAGTTREPVFDETETELAPDRYHCFHCGATSATDAMGMGVHRCPQCQQPMAEDSFFPAEYGPVVRQVGEEVVPNGMVAQNLYSPLEVDCDPAANNLRIPICTIRSLPMHRASFLPMAASIASPGSRCTRRRGRTPAFCRISGPPCRGPGSSPGPSIWRTIRSLGNACAPRIPRVFY
jgi:ribosomal protein L37AE/L43A